MSQLPPLSAVRAFEAAGRHENFSRAAEELGMTQAAVSYQIRQLERQVGQQLFARENGRVRLTDIGRRLIGPVGDAFSGMRQAFADLGEESAGVLAVSASVSLGNTWLSASIGRFQLRFPDLALRLSISNEVTDLSRGEFDLAIRAGRGHWDGLRADFLFRLHHAPLCSPEFAEQHNLREPHDLFAVERLAPNDPIWADWFALAGVGETLPPSRHGLLFDNQSQEAVAAQGGFGIAMMTPFFWRAELESGRLVQPFGEVLVRPISHYLVHPERRVGVRKIERFREWLHEELSNQRDMIPEAARAPFDGEAPADSWMHSHLMPRSTVEQPS
jgi:LysR family glycine cleavage system transcriptional activator